jgi:hypothetical protein
MSAHSKAAAKRRVIEFSSILMQDCLAEGGLNLPPQAGPALWGLGWAPGYSLPHLAGTIPNILNFSGGWQMSPLSCRPGSAALPAPTLHAAEPPEFHSPDSGSCRTEFGEAAGGRSPSAVGPIFSRNELGLGRIGFELHKFKCVDCETTSRGEIDARFI